MGEGKETAKRERGKHFSGGRKRSDEETILNSGGEIKEYDRLMKDKVMQEESFYIRSASLSVKES